MNKKAIIRFVKPGNYFRYFRHVFNRSVLHYLEAFCAPNSKKSFKYPPVFIVGAPRSGSTLLFQVISDSFDIGFLTNAHCKWFGFPTIATAAQTNKNRKQSSCYESKDGVISGKYGPSECGEWWYRFFRRSPAFVTCGDVEPQKMNRFRRSLLYLESSIGKPVVFKNLYASLRIGPIRSVVPESLFVVVFRNEIDNATSILNGRFRNMGSFEEWWSVPPPNIEVLRTLPVYEQVINQVREINQTIIDSLKLASVPPEDIVVVPYEKLCLNPEACMDEVEVLLRKKGWQGERRRLEKTKFETRHQRVNDDVLDAQLRKYSAQTQEDRRGVYVK